LPFQIGRGFVDLGCMGDENEKKKKKKKKKK
jgi:hypothetical protein